MEMNKRQFISHLLHLFTRGQIKVHQCLAVASNESVPQPNDVYNKGDLGFEPKHIHLEVLDNRSESAVEETTETVIDHFATFDTSSQYELEERQIHLRSSTPSSDTTSEATTSMETKKSSDSKEEDMLEAYLESIDQENEEHSSAESEKLVEQ
ncbi:uncharacterized protein [Venturia canescens]|uniref:uncharacterized protein isoform X2 n=1 Tax=Venturia canescens TaxID=32260 RepID=UPI001C9C0EC2|nr:uncharacterized protein LOC122408763 isoform X2 [Venturia canescens]